MGLIFICIILLILFSISLFFLFSKKTHKRTLGIILIVIVIISAIYLHQSTGKMSYSIGPLKVTIEKEFAETRNLEITNNTNKNVTEVIKIASTNAIDNLNFSKGSEFVNLTEGGIGKNDMTFSINMPPKSIISGVASTGGTLIVYSRSSKTDK